MKRLWLILLCSFLFTTACGMGNSSDQLEGVVEQIEDTRLFVGPEEQNPEEQYELVEVRVDQETVVTGDISAIDQLGVGDTVKIDVGEMDGGYAVRIEVER